MDDMASKYPIVAIKKKAANHLVKIMADSLVSKTNRGYAGSRVRSFELSLYDKSSKTSLARLIKSRRLCDSNAILLAGALNMENVKEPVKAIIDNNWKNYREAALIALCRLGDPAALKLYFKRLDKLSLGQAFNDHWQEVEYIKQPESIEFLTRVLNSGDNIAPVKENWKPHKIAFNAAGVLSQIVVDFPSQAQYQEETDSNLQFFRDWMNQHNQNKKINRREW